MSTKKKLSPEEREELLLALRARFEKNMNRHIGLEWAKVQAKLDPPAIGTIGIAQTMQNPGV